MTPASCWARRSTDKTPAGLLPRAYVIRLTSQNGTQILHMFDAACEYFSSPERTQELQYLNKAETFILIVDPLSVEAFWDRLLPGQQSALGPARSPRSRPNWPISTRTKSSKGWEYS